MREIKFRAVVIDDDGNERLEYNVSPTGPAPGMRHLRGFVDNGGFWMDCKRFEQFTGLKDKNGVEIYEGDILKFFDDKPIASVVFKEFGGWSFNWIDATYKRVRSMNPEPFFHNINLFEVIGNIYENPELL